MRESSTENPCGVLLRDVGARKQRGRGHANAFAPGVWSILTGCGPTNANGSMRTVTKSASTTTATTPRTVTR